MLLIETSFSSKEHVSGQFLSPDRFGEIEGIGKVDDQVRIDSVGDERQ